MDREESKKILMVIQVSYPNWHPVDLTMAINTWHLMLEEYQYREVEAALKAFILTDTSGFAPTIGQLVEKIHNLRKKMNVKNDISELEAWSLVYKAICNSNYHAEEEFEKLPPAVQKAVGGPANLREWAQMESDTVQSVEQSHFLRSYRAAIARQETDEKLPESMKLAIASQRNKALEVKDGEEKALRCL